MSVYGCICLWVHEYREKVFFHFIYFRKGEWWLLRSRELMLSGQMPTSPHLLLNQYKPSFLYWGSLLFSQFFVIHNLLILYTLGFLCIPSFGWHLFSKQQNSIHPTSSVLWLFMSMGFAYMFLGLSCAFERGLLRS